MDKINDPFRKISIAPVSAEGHQDMALKNGMNTGFMISNTLWIWFIRPFIMLRIKPISKGTPWFTVFTACKTGLPLDEDKDYTLFN